MIRNLAVLRPFCSTNLYINYRHSHGLSSPNEYSEAPEYPDIVDISEKGQKLREIESWHKKISSLPTVEQKLTELNIPKYYGWHSFQISDNEPPSCAGDFLRYATRTHVESGLPATYYEDVKTEAEKYLPQVKEYFELLAELHFKHSISRKVEKSSSSVEQESSSLIFMLNKYLCSLLSNSANHLSDVQIDLRPRIEAFWFLGGVEWEEEDPMKINKIGEKKKEKLFEYDTRPLQSYATPNLRVRLADGLPEVLSMSETEQYVENIPVCHYLPSKAQYFPEYKHARILPGFWTGVDKEHGHLFYHTSSFLSKLQKDYDYYDRNTIIQRKLLTAGFSQALSHAMWLGFAPTEDISYPVVQQSVLTDGKKVNFSLYQFNTSKLHSDHGFSNPKTNVMWISPELDLFEALEDGKVKGINDDAIVQLISMYLKKPIPRADPTPCLAPYKHLHHFPALEEYKQDFQDNFKHLLTYRTRIFTKPRIELWEYFFKIKFNTKPYLSPKKWFETVPIKYKDINPEIRRLDEYETPYIRKRHREKDAMKIDRKPRINTEKLYKYDKKVLKRSVLKDHEDWLD